MTPMFESVMVPPWQIDRTIRTQIQESWNTKKRSEIEEGKKNTAQNKRENYYVFVLQVILTFSCF